jgi:hypothetical protein
MFNNLHCHYPTIVGILSALLSLTHAPRFTALDLENCQVAKQHFDSRLVLSCLPNTFVVVSLLVEENPSA